ncbi:FadR/GntR family transcriptional regulator, partial [uncultured Parasutterella sp.]|uniref:FadR/GntR family transcriptional regulator n=1 Tax=uncultured Parasutterella sp. TaxID=1263098 RepID=UPI0027296579
MTRYKVRQALDLLVQMGVVERQKKRGTIIKRLATNDMTYNILEQLKLAGFDEEEFNEARLMIELAVIPFVIQRLTPAIQAQMRQLAQNIRLYSEDPLKADAFLMEFHLLMLHSCGNRVMEVFAGVVRTYFKSTKHLI